LVPFLFGVGSAVGACAALYVLYLSFAQEPFLVTALAYQTAGRVATLALLPFLAYVSFALSFLLVDLLRAILRTPGRIEALRQDVHGGK
jgi:hypothetical protein